MKPGPAAAALTNRQLNEVEFARQQPRLRSYPVVVDVVLTKACNFACTFCRDYKTQGAQRISVANFERVAAQVLPTAMRLSICSGGEPYLHAGLEEILAIAKRYNSELYVWLLSNGSLVSEPRIRRIIEQDLVTEHGFSVDGATAATVQAIRINADFDTIIGNVRTLLRLKRALGRTHPMVTIRYALMRTNVAELAAAVAMWGDMGVDYIDADYVALANGMPRDLSLFHHQQLAADCCAEARAVAKHYPGLALSLPEPIEDQRKYLSAPRPCRYPWQFVMIDSNGQVLPCYRAFEALRFSSVYEPAATRFDAIWNSDGYQRLRATVNDDRTTKFYPYCVVCEMRYGWSRERPHLGDDAWTETLGAQWLPGGVDHTRPSRGTASTGSPRTGRHDPTGPRGAP